MAIDLLKIQSPPNTLFQGISTDFKNNLTYAEFLLGVLKKLNETIIKVNEDSAFIDNYTGKIEEIEAEIVKIWAYFDTQKAQIDEETDAKIEALHAEVQSEIYLARQYLIAYIDTNVASLENEIDQITLGAIDVYDPTTGMKAPLQTVLDNIYGAGRTDAITATEYDALELTATAYDALDITAFDYDNNGKSLLISA